MKVFQSTRWRIVLVAMVAIAALAMFLLLKKHDVSPVPSNSTRPEQLRELRLRAEGGDAAAKYALSLHVDNPAEVAKLIKEAAEAGYGPAMVTYASTFAEQPDKSVKLLERAAMNGYIPAIPELVKCIDSGDCGKQSGAIGLKWAMAYEALRAQGTTAGDTLKNEETRLAQKLSDSERKSAQQQADQLVKLIPWKR